MLLWVAADIWLAPLSATKDQQPIVMVVVGVVMALKISPSFVYVHSKWHSQTHRISACLCVCAPTHAFSSLHVKTNKRSGPLTD